MVASQPWRSSTVAGAEAAAYGHGGIGKWSGRVAPKALCGLARTRASLQVRVTASRTAGRVLRAGCAGVSSNPVQAALGDQDRASARSLFWVLATGVSPLWEQLQQLALRVWCTDRPKCQQPLLEQLQARDGKAHANSLLLPGRTIPVAGSWQGQWGGRAATGWQCLASSGPEWLALRLWGADMAESERGLAEQRQKRCAGWRRYGR